MERGWEAFRLALVREPGAEELARGAASLRAAPDQPAAPAGQVLWAPVAGPEFLTNHWWGQGPRRGTHFVT